MVRPSKAERAAALAERDAETAPAAPTRCDPNAPAVCPVAKASTPPEPNVEPVPAKPKPKPGTVRPQLRIVHGDQLTSLNQEADRHGAFVDAAIQNRWMPPR